MKQNKLYRVNQSALHADYALLNSLVYIEHEISSLTKVEHLSNQLRLYPTFCERKRVGCKLLAREVSLDSLATPRGGC
ncbi:hypothetical protein C1M59_15500 [Vibrio diazotrophicus]|nr:hypothetical protein C1M59_15500 [Vibrio diazotrophicus]